jgi:F0F1-type ATP synthase membrane subunit c/vacuolar-type H+-ATPase subunit K
MSLLVVLPTTLIVFGVVGSFLLLGEAVPDAVAYPAALAYGVPGFFAGLGMAIIYRRGIRVAVAAKPDFARVLTLAVMPETSALFGLILFFFLIGRGSKGTGFVPFGTEWAWLVSALATVGGIGGPLGARLAASAWDFATRETFPRALVKSAQGGYVTVACFALALVLLGGWLVLALVLVYFGGALALSVLLFLRARRTRLRGTRPS